MLFRDHPYMSRILFGFVLAFVLVTSVSAQSTALTQSARTLDGQISIRLPQGWMSRDAASVIMTSVLAVGDTAESLQSEVNFLSGQPSTLTSARMNGFVGIVTPQIIATLPTSLAMSTLLNAMIADLQSIGGRVVEQQSLMLGGQYPATIAVVSIPGEAAKGIVGVFQAGADIAEFQIGASPERAFDANRQMFFDIINSIRIPAEAGQPVQPTPVVATPAPLPTLAVPQTAVPVTLETFRSGDKRVSLNLPAQWTTLDHMADQNTLAYGESPEAAQARLASARPDLAKATTLNGRGGLVILYPASAFKLDPNKLDLAPLMMQALAQLKGQGYIVGEAKPLEGTTGGLYASIKGNEIGYLALIPFGDQVAYVTATGVGPNAQPEDSALMAILGSIHVPALPEASGGLGGLGGLVATPEVTPKAKSG